MNTKHIICGLLLCVIFVSCTRNKTHAEYRNISYFDGISIAKITGDWYLAKGSDKRVPISETYDDLPEKITIIAEHSEGGDDIMFWSIYADGIFGSGYMGLSVDLDGDFLGHKGIVGGSLFIKFLFRHDKGVLTMMVYTLVTDDEGSGERIHVANYYKVAEQVAASDR